MLFIIRIPRWDPFFLSSKYDIYFLLHGLTYCIKVATIIVEQLDSKSNCFIEQLWILLRTRCDYYDINGFTHEEIAEFAK